MPDKHKETENVGRSRQRRVLMDCGGKRSATPLWHARMCIVSSSGFRALESGVVAALCHRSPKLSRSEKFFQNGGSRRQEALNALKFEPCHLGCFVVFNQAPESIGH
jgi:hypothetical protein